MEKRKHFVILAAGDFPTHEVPLRALRDADMVVCCDSAYGAWKASGEPSAKKDFVVVGDGDSLSDDDKHLLGSRWVLIDEQDYNDLHKAMEWVSAECRRTHSEPPRVTIVGATGKREDHTLGNMGYLVTFAEEHPGYEVTMLTDYGCCQAMTGERSFATFPRQQISIVSMTPDAAIWGSGLKWPLEGMYARRWWQATLNEALGNEVVLRSDGWLVVFQTYEGK